MSFSLQVFVCYYLIFELGNVTKSKLDAFSQKYPYIHRVNTFVLACLSAYDMQPPFSAFIKATVI